MNKLYPTVATSIVCSLLAFGCLNAHAQQQDFRKASTPSVQLKKAKAQASRATGINDPQPQHIESYSTEDITGQTWTLSSVSEIKYDKNNNKLSEKNIMYDLEGNYSFSTNDFFTYDALGNMVENITKGSVDNKNWVNEDRHVMGYDKIRKQVPVLQESFTWNDQFKRWMLNEEDEDGFCLELERDAQNRIVKNKKWLNSTKSIALVSQEFSYGEEGPATGLVWYALNDNLQLEPAYVFENMVWKNSDCQYLIIAPNVFYPFDMDPKNVLQSYTIYAANPDGTKNELMANYQTAYDEQDRLSAVKIVFADGYSSYKCRYQYDLDENGSFEMYESSFFDENQDGQIDEYETEIYRTATTCDSHGEIIKEEIFATDPSTGEEIQQEGYRYDMTYDKNGLLQQLIISYKSDYVTENNGYAYLAKMLYSDYTGISTAISNVSSAPASVSLKGNSLHFNNAQGAHYTLCDTQGKVLQHGVVTNDKVAVDQLPRGLYIVKINGKHARNAVKLIKL